MLCGVDRPPIRPTCETLTGGSGKTALSRQNIGEESRAEQGRSRNKVRVAGKALRGGGGQAAARLRLHTDCNTEDHKVGWGWGGAGHGCLKL